MLDPVRRGLERSGRSLEDLDVAAVVPVAVDEDEERARAIARPWMAFYLGAMGAKGKNFYVDLAERYGHGAARACQDRFLAGDREGAAAAVSDALLEAGAICTTPAGLPARLAAYEAAGVTTLVAIPSGERAALVRMLAETQRTAA